MGKGEQRKVMSAELEAQASYLHSNSLRASESAPNYSPFTLHASSFDWDRGRPARIQYCRA
jgi:hypothetical protein